MAIKTFTTGEVLTAADTNAYLANSGLVYVAGASFSNITTGAPLDVNSVFSSTYKNYVLILRIEQTTAAGSFLIRLRTTGAQEAGAVYNMYYGGGYVGAGPSYNWNGYSSTPPATPDTYYFSGMVPASNYNSGSRHEIMNPQAAQATRFLSQSFTSYQGTYSNVALTGSGSVENTTSYTGFRLFPITGTSSGEYQLYGYRIA
jgi:hypothetical protein